MPRHPEGEPRAPGPGADFRIVALAPNPWSGPWMNRQQLLSRIARRHPVLYSTGPRRLARGGASVWTPRLTRQDGVLVDQLPAWTSRWAAHAATRRAMMRYLARRWRAAVSAPGPSPLGLWIFHPKYRPYVPYMAADRLIYHVYDLYHLQKDWNDHLAGAQQWLARNADLVVASSASIASYLSTLGARNPVVVENGADYDAFAIDPPTLREPEDLGRVPRPRIGYTGALNRKVDFPLLLALARRRSEWQVVLVGAIGNLDAETAAAVDGLQALPNVHFLGFKDHRELPHYVGHMDVNLLAYRLSPHLWTQGIYPLKLHEYLAAGHPVVSADLSSVRPFGSVVSIANGVDGWERAIDRALLDDEAGPSSARRAVARANSWDVRARLLENRLRDLFESGGDGVADSEPTATW